MNPNLIRAAEENGKPFSSVYVFMVKVWFFSVRGFLIYLVGANVNILFASLLYNKSARIILPSLGQIVQSLMLLLTATYTGFQLRIQRKNLDPKLYIELFGSAKRSTLKSMKAIVAINLFYSVFFVTMEDIGGYLESVSYVICQVCISFVYSGVTFLLVFEQLLSKSKLIEVEELARKDQLTLDKYLDYQEDIERRDKNSPLFIVLASAALSTFIGIMTLFIIANEVRTSTAF